MLSKCRTVLSFALLASLFAAGVALATTDGSIPPSPVTPDEYSSRNLDGSHPYGESHGVEIGVDVTLSHYEDCLAVYTTRAWKRPLGGGQKTYDPKSGKIEVEICEEAVVGVIHSASRPGLTGDFLINDDGTYTADYSENGGNTRVWHPIP